MIYPRRGSREDCRILDPEVCRSQGCRQGDAARFTRRKTLKQQQTDTNEDTTYRDCGPEASENQPSLPVCVCDPFILYDGGCTFLNDAVAAMFWSRPDIQQSPAQSTSPPLYLTWCREDCSRMQRSLQQMGKELSSCSRNSCSGSFF